jgi:acyl-CoA hydrolase
MNASPADLRMPAATGIREFPFASILRPSDRICFGQACSEPVGLLRELLRQGDALHAKLGRLKLFVAGSYSGLLKPELAAFFDFSGYGAIGDGALLAREGQLEIHPIHYSQLPALLSNEWQPDVVLLQLSPPNQDGRHSLGVASDYQLGPARRARLVIAEVNARTPFSPHALLPSDLRIDYVVYTDEPLVEAPLTSVDVVAEQVASHVASLVDDGATLQMGPGSLMEAICRALQFHRDLGIHTGILIDGMADLMKIGAVTNARKGSHVGFSVAGSLLGSRKLFKFADRNPNIFLAETDVTHSEESLSRQFRFCSINSAVEVDLTGQVNAEVSVGRYIGAVGGQVDFVRAASRCAGGRSIIALPATAKRGAVSRIVKRLSGPVTTARNDVDCVVSEWGVAHLRRRSLRERAKAMADIAHPDHREALLQAAQAQEFW